MYSGYVLDFGNRTVAEFFTGEFGVDIYASRGEGSGTSKARRLRFDLRNNPASMVVRTLQALWD